jgi:hypothetical protein
MEGFTMASSESGNILDGVWVICPYITKNGKRIYPKNAKVFKFFVPRDKVR